MVPVCSGITPPLCFRFVLCLIVIVLIMLYIAPQAY